MRNLLSDGLAFVKENPRIIYSLVLLIFVPAGFFFNTYSLISGMEHDIDRITQRKAILAEKMINIIAAEQLNDAVLLQNTVNRVIQENSEILSLSILRPENNLSHFRIIASSEEASLDETTNNPQYLFSWSQSDGIAFLDSNEGGRFWRVTRSLYDESGTKSALVTMVFSLRDSDQLINSTVNRSYVILIITVLIVLLLVSNQARLFGYALTLSKLKEVDAMKDNLVSMASHELRSPLTAIRGYIELLEEKNLNLDEEGRKYFSNISLSVHRLNLLVNDILEVSRLEGNRTPFAITECVPGPIITQSVEELRSQAMEKHLDLRVAPLDHAVILADSNRLKEILVNLIGNAIKYTPKGSVSVSASAQGKTYRITVADTGVGISAEDQEKLFQKFSRIQNDDTKTISGTGLGLWITLELAKRMGGSITVESIRGVGSHFTLHLPLVTKAEKPRGS